MPSGAQPTLFLIADISGYTGYLADVELDHAQDILADLIGAIVTALRPNFRLAKLEGDAAFTFATVEKVDGSMLLDTIERCYFGFRRRRRDVRQATSCECTGCIRIPDLDLKFVVHHGAAILQKVAGRQELLGSDVIVAHRLLKNEVVEKLGLHAYALISQKCIDASDIDPAALGMVEHSQTYDRIGEVPLWVHDVERRWQEEEARARLVVTPEDSKLTLSIPTNVPPQVAWEFLTKPGQRMSWQPWVTEVTIVGATGGRRGPGSANHCMHGRDAVVEEILDWRPYDYVTDRTILDTPTGPVKVLHTIELEPDAAGTTIHSGSVHRRPSERRSSWSGSPQPMGRHSGRASPVSSRSWKRHSRLGTSTMGPNPSWPRRGRTGLCRGFSRLSSLADRRAVSRHSTPPTEAGGPPSAGLQASMAGSSSPHVERLILAGIVAPIVAWGLSVVVIAGWPGYDAVAQSISLLANAPLGWLQTVAFASSGLLGAAWAFGLPRVLGTTPGDRWIVRILLLVQAAIAIGFALLPTDREGAPMTTVGALHLVDFYLYAVTMPLTLLALGLIMRRDPRWHAFVRPSLVAAGLAIGAALLVPATLDGLLTPWLGLLERLYVAIPSIWQVGAGIVALRLAQDRPVRAT